MPGASGITGGREPVLARSHHGSVSKEERALVEADLKSGRLRCVVATSSLELGIDMGAVDLVMQVESPPSVASGLQRIGRAGHQVGEVSKGVIFPKHRADLLHATVVAERMVAGAIESLRIPTNPLDVLAQQTIAAAAVDEWDVEGWFELVRRAAPFATLPRSAFDATLDLLAGRYPSDRFGDLRARIVWDRDAGTIVGRRGAQRLAVTSGGTIPDRGLFGVFMVGEAGPGRRVGELDEEMVYESRVGDVFALGATSWRIQEITHDRVLVAPAFGEPGRLPFWKGDGIGRPAELGEAIGGFIAELASATPADALARSRASGLDEHAASNLVAFIDDQRAATRVVPDATNLVVERFRDELGDWRIVLHSPYGMRVHAPWALAAGARVRERSGVDANAVASDDGIVLRMPDTGDDPPGAELFAFEPTELAQLVTDHVGGSALFAARFRECAARALILPRTNPGSGRRSGSSASAPRSCSRSPATSPTSRSCSKRCESACKTSTTCRPSRGSPSASATRAALRRGDHRVAEPVRVEPAVRLRRRLHVRGRRAARGAAGRRALLDPALLAELLGTVELRELLDPEVVAETESMLQRLVADRAARGDEGVADLLRELGPLTADEVAARVDAATDARAALAALVDARRAAEVRFAGEHGSPRSKTSAACATRSACRSRPACPRCSASRSAIRSATWSAGTHARTVRSRRTTWRGGSASARSSPPPRSVGSPANAAWSRASSSRTGPARVVRQRGAPAHSTPLARGPAQRDRTRRAARVRTLPARLAARRRAPPRCRRRRVGDRAARGRPHPRLRVGVVRAARARRRLPPGDARRAHRLGRGALGRVGIARRRRRLDQPPPRRHR